MLAPLVRNGLFSWGLHCLGERAEAPTQMDLPVQGQCALERLRVAWQSPMASGEAVQTALRSCGTSMVRLPGTAVRFLCGLVWRCAVTACILPGEGRAAKH